MAWTAPRTWSVGEVATAANFNTYLSDNLKYLKGQAGAVQIEDRVEIPTTNANRYGLRFTSGSTGISAIQGLDASSIGYLLFQTNREFDGSVFQQLNTRAGGLIQFFNDTFAYFTFPAASSTPTERWRIDGPTGHMGIGTNAPQGRIHGYDAIGGFLHWKYDGVDGTARTIIPDGTGDVLYYATGIFQVRTSGGNNAATSAIGLIAPGAGGQDFYNNAGNILHFDVAANGSVTVQRTGGSLTYKVNIWLLWM